MCVQQLLDEMVGSEERKGLFLPSDYLGGGCVFIYRDFSWAFYLTYMCEHLRSQRSAGLVDVEQKRNIPQM